MKKLTKLITRKDVRETSWALLTKGTTFILFYLLTFFLSTGLGKENFGEWQTLFSFSMILSTICYLGLDRSTQKFAAQHNYSSYLNSILFHSIILRFLESILFIGGIYLIAPYILPSLNLSFLTELLFWILLFVFFMSFSTYFKKLFEGLHTLKFNFFINFTEYGFRLGAIIFLFFTQTLSLHSIIQSFTISVILSTLIGLFIYIYYFNQNLHKHYIPFRKTLIPNFTLVKQLLAYSAPLLLISIGFILMAEIDILMLNILSNSSEVGAYSLAKQLIVKLPQISLALAGGTLPIFAKLSNENVISLRKYFFKLLKLVNIVFIPLSVGFIVLSPFVIPLIFGQEYTNAVIPTQILAVWLIFAANTIFFNQVLDYNGKAPLRSLSMLITIITNIALNIMFIPIWGSSGAALATLLGLIPSVLINIWMTKNLFYKL